MMKYILLLSVVFLVGCEVTGEEIVVAQRLCENNEGISMIHTQPIGSPSVACVNGAYFQKIATK